VNKKIIYASLLVSILLSACDGLITINPSSSEGSQPDSSQVTSTSTIVSSSSVSYTIAQEANDLFNAIVINKPYFTDDYVLPVINNQRVSLAWSGDHITLENDTLKHPFPTKDISTQLIATLTIEGQIFTKPYPIVFKSMLDAPYVNKVPELRFTLSQNRTVDDIYYEAEIPAMSSLFYDQHGSVSTQSITSPLGIRTRGHSTRAMPKKAYRVSYENNVSLLGMKKAKNYILLANYIDHSQLRNATIHYMSRFFPSLYPIEFRFVDVVINNTFMGSYLLTERVEFHPNRLDVPFIANAANHDSGFLVELDHPGQFQGDGQENVDYFFLNGRPYFMKEPNLDTLGYSQSHFNYIKNYFTNVYNRLNRREDVSSLIDIPSMIDYFLIQEVSKNVDVGWGSSYMYKAPGQPLRFGPLWDFDLSLGVADYFESGPIGHWGWKTFDKNDFFTMMMRVPTIYNAFITRLTEFQQTILPEVLAWLSRNDIRFQTMFARNIERWPLNACEGWCPIIQPLLQVNSYQDHVDFISDYLVARTTWMKNNIR
jgi:hypothetical protein